MKYGVWTGPKYSDSVLPFLKKMPACLRLLMYILIDENAARRNWRLCSHQVCVKVGIMLTYFAASLRSPTPTRTPACVALAFSFACASLILKPLWRRLVKLFETEGETMILNSFTQKRRQNGWKIDTRKEWVTFEVGRLFQIRQLFYSQLFTIGDFPMQFSIHQQVCRVEYRAWQACGFCNQKFHVL